MAFVNEYVSQEDIEKYGLDKLYKKYMEITRHKPTIKSDLNWIIDRERESWFMKVGFYMDPEYDYRMPTGELIYILHYKDNDIEVNIKRNSKKSSRKLSDNPFKIVFEILSIFPQSLKNTSKDEILELISEAFLIYKERDGYGNLLNTEVNVNYIGER